MRRGQGYFPFTATNPNSQTFPPPYSNLDCPWPHSPRFPSGRLAQWTDMLPRHPERASLGRASLLPCPLDSRLLSSATSLCGPCGQLRKQTSQQPLSAGPKVHPRASLSPDQAGSCNPREEPATTRLRQLSPGPPALPSLFLENPGPPRCYSRTHPRLPPATPTGRPASHRLHL